MPRLAEGRAGLAVRPELDALLAKAMAKEPDDRFPDAQAMLAALEAIPRPVAWLGAAPAQPSQAWSPAPALPASRPPSQAPSGALPPAGTLPPPPSPLAAPPIPSSLSAPPVPSSLHAPQAQSETAKIAEKSAEGAER